MRERAELIDRACDAVERFVWRTIVALATIVVVLFLASAGYHIHQAAVLKQQTPPIELRR